MSHRRSYPFVVCRGCFSPVNCTVSVSPLDPSSFPSLSFFRSLADVTSIARYSFRRAFLPFYLSTQLFQPHSRYGLNLTPCMMHQALPHCSSFPSLFQTSFLPRPRKTLGSHGRGQPSSKQNEYELGRLEYSLLADRQSRSRILTRVALQETRWYHLPCMPVRALLRIADARLLLGPYPPSCTVIDESVRAKLDPDLRC